MNSDFDEQKIDSATGYAKPDNADESLTAEQGDREGEIITDDLHKGFFGVTPGTLPSEFYTGATVTITKKAEEDEDTGRPETGTIRLYAIKDLGASGEQSVAISISTGDKPTISSDSPANLAATLYGASSTIPKGEGVTYWIEGVDPGPITLEFKYVKGDLTFAHEQKFNVVTRQTKQQWQEEIRQQILLQTDGQIDLANYSPNIADRFRVHKASVKAIYDYYQQLFIQMPEKFMWAGMARIAAAPIYAGMSDMGSLIDEIASTAGTDFLEVMLMFGQRDIFNDLGWQHRAYLASGIYALRHVSEDLGNTDQLDLDAWIFVDDGIAEEDTESINRGNRLLLQREQRDVVQPTYNQISLWTIPPGAPIVIPWLQQADALLSFLAIKNPMRRGPGFQELVPNGNLAVYSDRWIWIDDESSGMLSIWTGAAGGIGYTAQERLNLVNESMRDAALDYANFPEKLP